LDLVPARVPLDVDLEDKLLYGLTPVRLAYMVVAVLAGIALWSSNWAPVPFRAVAAAACIGVGATVSWGSWRGRAADSWIVDIVLFIARTHRVEWNRSWMRSLGRRPGGVVGGAAEPEGMEEAASLAA
jgi:hypothetical protein